jgi:predicted DNA-binding transcriptional regulator AlpA
MQTKKQFDVLQAECSADERLLRKKDVASRLACSMRSVDRLASLGQLTRVYVMGGVRFRFSQVANIIEGGAS